jgi:hypothetical protein
MGVDTTEPRQLDSGERGLFIYLQKGEERKRRRWEIWMKL